MKIDFVPEKIVVGFKKKPLCDREAVISCKYNGVVWAAEKFFFEDVGFKPHKQRDAEQNFLKEIKNAVVEFDNTPTSGFKLTTNDSGCRHFLIDPRGFKTELGYSELMSLLKATNGNLENFEFKDHKFAYACDGPKFYPSIVDAETDEFKAALEKSHQIVSLEKSKPWIKPKDLVLGKAYIGSDDLMPGIWVYAGKFDVFNQIIHVGQIKDNSKDPNFKNLAQLTRTLTWDSTRQLPGLKLGKNRFLFVKASAVENLSKLSLEEFEISSSKNWMSLSSLDKMLVEEASSLNISKAQFNTLHSLLESSSITNAVDPDSTELQPMDFDTFKQVLDIVFANRNDRICRAAADSVFARLAGNLASMKFARKIDDYVGIKFATIVEKHFLNNLHDVELLYNNSSLHKSKVNLKVTSSGIFNSEDVASELWPILKPISCKLMHADGKTQASKLECAILTPFVVKEKFSLKNERLDFYVNGYSYF